MLEKETILNDKWEILSHIATGGKGEVYRARQKNLDREVAIKIISPDFIESLEDDEEDLEAELARFKREVLVMAQTRHPNILQIYDYEKAEVDGREFEYIAMEYIPGATLRLTMPVEGFGNDEAGLRQWLTRYFFPLLDGVEAIHRLGIVHRDLKPENVLLDGDIPKIADFGLAGGKFLEPITRSHHALGTIIYMAPEQFSDMDLTDARADVYALGKILYEAVSGKMGKGTAFPLQTVSLSDPDTPYLKHLDQIIQQATTKDPNQRISSAKEFKHILERFLTDPSSATLRVAGAKELPSAGKTRKNWPIVMIVLLAGLLLAGVWYHFQGLPGMTKPQIPADQRPDVSNVTTADLASVPRTPGAKYISRDGAILRFVPGGEFHLVDDGANGSGKKIVVVPFFMEENEVTNHQYVEFLNEQIPRLEVENDVVKGDGEIWLLLGEVRDGYEPILFKDGMFVVNGPEHASFPVVRVTAYGAAACARYYGRRLPTVNEWLHAAQTRHLETDLSAKGSVTAEKSEDISIPADPHAMMHQQPSLPKGFDTSPSPVGETPANKFSIIGLNANVSEWVSDSSNGNGDEHFFVMGGLGEERADPTSKAVGRHPWEAFGTVGFRTVVSLDR